MTKYLSDLQEENPAADYITYLYPLIKKDLIQAVKQLISRYVIQYIN
ncbi:hypothetical protein P615_07160 [Brevibacillus laterosporus PE36]|nr:hypothetical protein P615_07160 [Brevibacillus laterosporus PE36]